MTYAHADLPPHRRRPCILPISFAPLHLRPLPRSSRGILRHRRGSNSLCNVWANDMNLTKVTGFVITGHNRTWHSIGTCSNLLHIKEKRTTKEPNNEIPALLPPLEFSSSFENRTTMEHISQDACHSLFRLAWPNNSSRRTWHHIHEQRK